jgi:hypothetical protein
MPLGSTISNVRPPAAGAAMRSVTALALLAATIVLPACTTAPYAGDVLPSSMGGLPANAPARPEVPPPFPAIHDMPPPRTNSVLTHEERRKVEEDLVAARERQPGRPKTAPPAKGTATKAAPSKGTTARAAPPKPAPPKTVPAKLEKDRP